MINLIRSGTYRLIRSKAGPSILYLDKTPYVWVRVKAIGEVLVASHIDHAVYALLSEGGYRMYEVKDEPALTDLTHLELEAGKGSWQSYLLLTGLPDDEKKRARIIPTRDCISANPTFTVNQREHAKAGSKGAVMYEQVGGKYE